MEVRCVNAWVNEGVGLGERGCVRAWVCESVGV